MKNKIVILIFLCISSNAYSQNWLKLKNESNDSLMILSSKVDSITMVVDSMNKVIDGFSVIRNWMENHLIDNYRDYYAKSLFELDTCLIDSLITIGKSVQSVKLETLIQELYTSKKYLHQYNCFHRLIEVDYDSSAIYYAQNQINNIIPKCSDVQRVQFEELLGKLQLDIVAIKKLYEIVNDITYRVGRYRDANDDFRSMRVAEDKLKTYAEVYVQYISKIPYTDSLYTNYKKAMLESPLEVSEYEKKILSFESLITNN